jgi:hypothetical protein
MSRSCQRTGGDRSLICIIKRTANDQSGVDLPPTVFMSPLAGTFMLPWIGGIWLNFAWRLVAWWPPAESKQRQQIIKRRQRICVSMHALYFRDILEVPSLSFVCINCIIEFRVNHLCAFSYRLSLARVKKCKLAICLEFRGYYCTWHLFLLSAFPPNSLQGCNRNRSCFLALDQLKWIEAFRKLKRAATPKVSERAGGKAL